MSVPDVDANTGRLEFTRILAASCETVWRYLVEEELRSKWLCSGKVEPFVGGTMEFKFNPRTFDQLPPEGFPEDTLKAEFDGKITAIEAPRLLAFTWPGEQEGSATQVTILLSPTDEGTKLNLVHERLNKPEHLVGALAGWHAHLEQLECEISHQTAPNFWERHTMLEAEYRDQFAN